MTPQRYSNTVPTLPISTPCAWPLPALTTSWTGATARLPNRKPSTTAPKSRSATACSANASSARSKTSTRTMPNTRACAAARPPSIRTASWSRAASSAASAWATSSLAVPVSHIWFLRGTPSAMGLLLGMTVKNLERVAYFASYIIKSVDAEKRDQLLADKEAEFAAAKEAIKLRYEKEAKAEDANVKALAEAQTKETEAAHQGLRAAYRDQISGLDRLQPHKRDRLPQPARANCAS